MNDQPVDLHMKLGEAGEAFFVREAEEECMVGGAIFCSFFSFSSKSTLSQILLNVLRSVLQMFKLVNSVSQMFSPDQL